MSEKKKKKNGEIQATIEMQVPKTTGSFIESSELCNWLKFTFTDDVVMSKIGKS